MPTWISLDIVLGLQLITAISLWFVFYHFIKQQGRLLLRLDAMERTLRPKSHQSNYVVPSKPASIEVGNPVTPLSVPDLSGQMVALSDFKGKRVLLVHWSPLCGFCDLIASELAQLAPGLEEANTALILLALGGADTNRKAAEKHGLNCPILLLEDSQSFAPFETHGTPVAYLLDEDGRVAEPLAVGADQVPDLARRIAKVQARKRLPTERSLAESRIERAGLKPGTPAPPFRLPDLSGRITALEEYRGRRVLLVFTDPHCGPCEHLVPHLVETYRTHKSNNLAMILVSRGDRKENERKAKEYGFEFPVVLQRNWELSKEYGIFATPVAFLVNEEGFIASPVAKGLSEILALTKRVELGVNR